MPLYKIEKIKEERYLAIWHIEESFDNLLALLNPSDVDHALVTGFKNYNKKLEWLSGRLCLKLLCAKMDITYEGVVKNANGKPLLKNNNAEISLTHSYPYAAAVIDKNTAVGIDLEQPKEKLKKVAHKFLSGEEIENGQNDVQTLCILWCAKETLYKICDKKKLSFKEEMRIEAFEPHQSGSLVGKVIVEGSDKAYKLEYRIEKDYIMTFNC